MKQQADQHPSGGQWNQHYDGILAIDSAPEGVWFCTTLYQGKFPTITPYPTGGQRNERYWRLFLQISHLQLHTDEWQLFFIKETRNGRNTERSIAFVRKNESDFYENKHGLQPLDKKENHYMFYEEEEEGEEDIDRRIRWKCPRPPIWTKVFIQDDISLVNLQHPTMFWDTVEKTIGV